MPIVPAMTLKGWKAKGWLGIITAGLLWIDFRDAKNFTKSIESLGNEIAFKAGMQLWLF